VEASLAIITYMAEPPSYQISARNIQNALSDDDRDWFNISDNFEETPAWYGQLLTQLALAIGEDEIEYVSTHIEVADDSYGATAAVYTSSRLIVARVTGNDATSASVVTSVVSRSNLESVDIMGGKTPFDPEQWSMSAYPWPGPIGLALRYSGESDIRLPLGHVTRERAARLAAFTPSLLNDLGR